MKILKNKQEKVSKSCKDTIVFMSAYKASGISKCIFSFQKKEKIKELLIKHHLSSVLTDKIFISSKGCLNIETEFNYIEQSTKYHFDVKKSKQRIEDFKDELSKLSWCFSLKNSLQLLLDSSYFKILFYINMESFLVYYNDNAIQVDPVVFYLNDVVMITFELIDYTTGYPFDKNSIFGIKNNYNIIPVSSYQYFGEDRKSADNRTIPQIIFDNVASFFNSMIHNKYKANTVSYVHNFLVVTSSDIENINQYFFDVLESRNIYLHLSNLNTNSCYEYYSKEFLGLVLYSDEENFSQALFSSILLESLKMTILLNQIVNHEITINLDETVYNNIYVNVLLLSSNTPIITQNVIKNIQQTETYKRNQKAIENKISYLSIKNEKRKSNNALLLNILLYFLTFIGSISTIQVLKDEFGWSFNICFIVISFVFVSLGLLWLIFELRKK